MIARADIVFRVDAPSLFRAGRALRGRGVLFVGLAAPFVVVGLVTTAYGIFCVATHQFVAGDVADLVIAAAGLVFFAGPLVVAVLLLALGVRRLARGARLTELSTLVHGRSHVTVLDLAARSGRAPVHVLATLALAERHAAAARL